ncbi:hypothetical protein CBL_02912, partial [Carabus blaptoides fortunei]
MSWSFADRPSQTYPFENHYPLTANVMEDVADTRAYELRSSEGADLSSDQRKQLNALLVKYHHNFKRGGEVTPFAEHSIDTGHNAPVAVPPYQLSSQKKAQLRVELDQRFWFRSQTEEFDYVPTHVPIWTAEDMRKKQLEDPEIAKIMDSLEAATPTSDSDRWVDR